MPGRRLVEKSYLAFGRFIYAGDQVKRSGFTGTIRSNNAHNFARLDLQIHILHGNQPTENFCDFFQVEQSTIHRLINSCITS